MKFLIASTPSDSHSWNLVYLQLLIEECGHEVINLGACVPTELLLARCREGADCLLISSVNGHGFQDGLRLAAAINREPSLAGMRLIIGGKLNTRASDERAMERALLNAGFDHVFQGEHAAADFKSYLGSMELAAPLAIRTRAPAGFAWAMP